jgi:hypothetical protein
MAGTESAGAGAGSFGIGAGCEAIPERAHAIATIEKSNKQRPRKPST